MAEMPNTQLYLAIAVPLLFNGGIVAILAMYVKSGFGDIHRCRRNAGPAGPHRKEARRSLGTHLPAGRAHVAAGALRRPA